MKLDKIQTQYFIKQRNKQKHHTYKYILHKNINRRKTETYYFPKTTKQHVKNYFKNMRQKRQVMLHKTKRENETKI